jgi:alpha-1,2-glucosyltransferase
MLYIWPLITFFSIPLILPVVVAHLRSLVTLLRTPLFPRLLFKYVFVALVTGGALVATLVIIKFNTIIHPFTLADNRHYMFYVFRYTILRHPAVRYLLAPVYLACAWCVYLTLCGSSSPRAAPVTLKDKKLASGPDSPKSAPVDERRADTETGGPRVSFIIVLLVSTALSLVGAPLVEPRYFILPWVIWRLNVPALPRSIAPSPPSRKTTKQSIRKSVGYTSPQAHDYRLWLETAWFLLINAVTGYIFLYRGFSWPQEPGKVQRFMW